MTLFDKLYIYAENYSTTSTISENALIIAIEQNNVEMMKILLTNSFLCKNQLLEESQQLKERSVVLHRKIKKTALYLAIEEGNIEIIKLLLDSKKINVNEKMEIKADENTLLFETIKMPALYQAINKGNLEILNY